METFDRYAMFREEGTINIVPQITLNVKDSDFYETYRLGISRLDRISYDYYGDANYDWLILMANPELPSMEFEIPDNTSLRIPYPLEVTLSEYTTKVKEYYKQK